jgi:hypothetical protein
VIAERGLELHAGVEQRLVRDLELPAEAFRSFAAVDVVADGDDEQGWEDRVHFGHLRGQLVLLLAAVAEIAEDEELERVGPVRQVEGGRMPRPAVLCAAARAAGHPASGALDTPGPLSQNAAHSPHQTEARRRTW